jgi:hypothetical protein
MGSAIVYVRHAISSRATSKRTTDHSGWTRDWTGGSGDKEKEIAMIYRARTAQIKVYDGEKSLGIATESFKNESEALSP